uniref:Uncharacterized protein n=1 Tax=Timema monikensis TaxID=170555 RepID=A0A7R9E6T6_9NEOP|nr:unnamed protein product [Timema monikensis]
MTKASQSLGCDTPEKRCGNAVFTGTSLLVYGPSVKDKSPGTFTLTYVVSLFITQTVQDLYISLILPKHITVFKEKSIM